MNRFCLLFPEMGFPATYYVAVNTLVMEQCAQEIGALPIPKFITWRGRRLLDATVGGKLAVLPKVDYRSVFATPRA